MIQATEHCYIVSDSEIRAWGTNYQGNAHPSTGDRHRPGG